MAEKLNNLAELQHAQGKYAEAVLVAQEALRVAEAIDLEHPGVAQSLNNLAELQHAQGNYAEAEPLYQRSQAILENALGPNHLGVATALENYSGLL